MMSKNYEPKHFNIFFVNEIQSEDGYHDMGSSSQSGIIIENSMLNTVPYILLQKSAGPIEFKHHMGHYLELYHTHEPSTLLERKDRTNCETTADSVCDTYADIGDLAVTNQGNGCKVMSNNTLHPVEHKFFTSLFNNYMSNYFFCLNSFTIGLLRRIAKVIKRNINAHY